MPLNRESALNQFSNNDHPWSLWAEILPCESDFICQSVLWDKKKKQDYFSSTPSVFPPKKKKNAFHHPALSSPNRTPLSKESGKRKKIKNKLLWVENAICVPWNNWVQRLVAMTDPHNRHHACNTSMCEQAHCTQQTEASIQTTMTSGE